ncbi:MAG: AI-2E family transporter, partial [Patescibacteria group bacterium]
FRPFWVVLVLGVSFSVVLYPVYEWLKEKMKTPDWLSSALTVLLFVFIVAIPLFGIGVMVFNQSQDAYHVIVNNVDSLSFLDTVNVSINKILPENMSFDLYDKLSGFISFVVSNITGIFTFTLSAIFSALLTLLAVFYFLKDGASWKKSLITLSPLADTDDEKIIQKLSNGINGILKQYLLMALVQGILMGVGLTLFGVPNPALWGLVTIFAALVPTIGTALISIPAIIFLYATGHAMAAAGLLVWSISMVGMIDNLLSPVIVGKKINLPPFLILFSVLGGLSLLGPIGILMGPLTVSLLHSLLSIYRHEFQPKSIT